MTTMKRNARVLFASAATIALATGIGAAPASAETATADALTYARPGDGLTGMPSAAGTLAPMNFILDASGTEVYAYCVQLSTPIDEAAKFTPTAWSDSSVSNLAKAADLAKRHDSIGTPYGDARWEAAVTQAAIWNLTDGLDLSSIPNTGFATRAQELVAAASAVSEPAFRLTIEPSASFDKLGQVVVDAKVSNGSGPLADSRVSLTVGDTKTVALTNAAGVASFPLPAKFAGQSADISAQTDVAAGVFLKASSGQSLITASAAPVTSKVTFALPAAPAPSPTATPTATPAPQVSALATPSTPAAAQPQVTAVAEAAPEAVVEQAPEATVPVSKGKKPKELPHTGGELSPVLVLFLALVGVAAAAGFFYTRRSK